MAVALFLFAIVACIPNPVQGIYPIQYLTSDVPTNGAQKSTLITSFSSSGTGQTGFKFSGFPFQVTVPDTANTRAWNLHGKSITVYPAAVHGKHYGIYMWTVLRVYIKQTNRVIYVQINDRCDQGSSSCNTNLQPSGFLVDVHTKAATAAGSSDLYSYGQFSYLWRLTSDKLISLGKGGYMDSWLNCVCDIANCYPENLGGAPYWCPKGR
jgi:hypothetical protein